MAKKKPTLSPVAPKLQGKKVAFVGKFGRGPEPLEALHKLVAREGGVVVEFEKEAPDILVGGMGVGGNPPAAITKALTKPTVMEIFDEDDFYTRIAPTAEEFWAFLNAGPHTPETWVTVCDPLEHINDRLNLNGRDFRNIPLENARLICANIDAADFRGGTWKNVTFTFGNMTQANFDGATLKGGFINGCESCTFRKATLDDVRWASMTSCDLSGAKVRGTSYGHDRLVKCNFANADLSDSTFDRSEFELCGMVGVRFTGCRLHEAEFKQCSLSQADFRRAFLHEARFKKCDLRKADFRGAILAGADFTGSDLEGADFTGAVLAGMKAKGVDTSKAKGFIVPPKRTAGPKLQQLAKVAKDATQFSTSIVLDLGQGDTVELTPGWSSGGRGHASAGYGHLKAGGGGMYTSIPANTFAQAVLDLSSLFAVGTPILDSVQVEAKGSALGAEELKTLCVQSWCEAFGLPIPTEMQLAELRRRAESLPEELLAEIRGGAAGVARWNARTDRERRVVKKLRGTDFSKAYLAGALLGGIDFTKSKFDGANLANASFGGTLQESSFVGANLAGADLAGTKSSDSSFAKATLTKCNLRAANFRRCDFRGADLTGSDFCHSDLGGADLGTAILKGAEFGDTKFDEKTILPKGFIPPEGMVWKGAGPRPGTAPPPPIVAGSLDFDGFVQQLSLAYDAARIAKARQMLKAERFELFADVTDTTVTGIVKSQSSRDLVYSCRLTSDGHFGCCTQNLRPCGGLRGAACKHLLVLVLGLAKAGRLDPAAADGWLKASKAEKPAIDEPAMSETFLKYKGAEAGEIDWRPTETLPEDFYSM